jgi:hypothetical protein
MKLTGACGNKKTEKVRNSLVNLLLLLSFSCIWKNYQIIIMTRPKVRALEGGMYIVYVKRHR